jgi:hypothetical protein
MPTQTATLAKLRFTTIASLPRTIALRGAFEDAASDRSEAGELLHAPDGICCVVAEQERHGYPIVVVGGCRRTAFAKSLSEAAGPTLSAARRTAVHQRRTV